MSLAANIRNGCNRLIGENDMITIDITQFDAVSCIENPLVSEGFLRRDFLNYKGSHFILIGLFIPLVFDYSPWLC